MPQAFVPRASWKLFSVIALLAFALISTQAPADESPSLIEVSATGTASATPDEANLRIVFSAEDLEVRDARETVDDQVGPFLKGLKKFSLKPDTLDSSQTRIYPQYDYRDGNQQLRAYRVVRTVHLTLGNLEQLEALIKLITDSDASRLEHIDFALSSPEILHKEALDNAIRHSRALAEQLAAGYDVDLGKIHRVQHHASEPMSAPQPRMMAMEMARADKAPTYQQKDLEVMAQVSVAFTIK